MSDDDFLSESSVAGQTLLRLVSRGNAVIAELLRLSRHVPAVFLLDEKDKRRYGDLIFDFRYLKSQEYFENKVESSADLSELDDEFKDNHLDLLDRFFRMFESIYIYATDLQKFLSDLDDGIFIQLTLENVLLSTDGKQLLAEAIYLFGVMLLLLDLHIDGVVRERLLISYYRYKGQGLQNVDEVANLIRSTGFSAALAHKKPSGYPEEYFARIKFPSHFISMVIGRLRTDDVYNQIKAYPLPEHRSTALANQASMLYVILYFAPQILNKEQAVMREIVDKHFADNWVISFYMGTTVDLTFQWDAYKAARAALANTTQPDNIRSLQERHVSKVEALTKRVMHFLTEGVLTDEFVLDNISKLLSAMRDANVTVRWLLLHLTTSNKKLRELVVPGSDANKVLVLLLNVAQFEYVLKNIFQSLLEGKQARWDDHQGQAADRMKELAEYFSGEKPLTRVEKDEQLQQWSSNIADQITSFDFNDSTLAGRKIQQLIQAMEEVEQFHQIETSRQVKQFLAETRNLLYQMLRTINIKEEVLVTISIVSDLSFAWHIMGDYVDMMQERIKRDPSSTIKLRATFLKLVSILDLPLIRIMQCESPDLESVSEFYSGELVAYVRRVLAIIPKSMFVILNEIMDIQTFKLRELPTRVEKMQLKEFAQLEQRHELARATHSISVFTEGILALETTLVGVIEVDPKKLLEDGIRKELVGKIAEALDSVLVFKSGKVADMEARLRKLANTLDGFRRSFEYIGDYVNIYGLKIWQEEFSRIINYYVEQECNSFLKKKVYDWQSEYQSVAIPIPRFQPQDDQSVNFIGRLAREIMSQTESRRTVFVDQMSAWLDPSGKEVIGIRTFSQLQDSVGIFGLTGLDKLMSFMIVRDLQKMVRFYQMDVIKSQYDFLTRFSTELDPVTTLPRNAYKLYATATDKLRKLWPAMMALTIKIGQRQLIRRMICHELNFAAKLDSNIFLTSLNVLNDAVLKDIDMHYRDPEKHPYPKENSALLGQVATYLDWAGVEYPFNKIYVTSEPLDWFPLFLVLFVLSQLGKMRYDPQLGTLVSKDKKEALDGAPFVVGIITILKQFHSVHTQRFLAYLGQNVRALIFAMSQKDTAPNDLLPEITNVLLFLEDFCKLSHMSRRGIESYVPAYVFDRFKK